MIEKRDEPTKLTGLKKFIKRLELEILLKRTENELNLGVLTDTMTDEKADSLFNVQDSLGVELDKLKKQRQKEIDEMYPGRKPSFLGAFREGGLYREPIRGKKKEEEKPIDAMKNRNMLQRLANKVAELRNN